MTKDLFTITQTYIIDRTNATTESNSIIAMKQDIIDRAKASVAAMNIGFSFNNATSPNGAVTAQTIIISWDTPYAAYGEQNYKFVIALIICGDKANSYVSLNYCRFDSGVGAFDVLFSGTIYITSNAPISTYNVLSNEVAVDFSSRLLVTEGSVTGATLRRNFVNVKPSERIIGDYVGTLVKYKDIRGNNAKDYWGYVINNAFDVRGFTLPATYIVLGYAIQLSYGWFLADDNIRRVMSLNKIYLSQANNQSYPLSAYIEAEGDMLLIAASEGMALGDIYRIENDEYYVACMPNGKAILCKITPGV
jgi:hypothetical protein